jgi:hypothetical protein
MNTDTTKTEWSNPDMSGAIFLDSNDLLAQAFVCPDLSGDRNGIWDWALLADKNGTSDWTELVAGEATSEQEAKASAEMALNIYNKLGDL